MKNMILRKYPQNRGYDACIIMASYLVRHTKAVGEELTEVTEFVIHREGPSKAEEKRKCARENRAGRRNRFSKPETNFRRPSHLF